MRWYYILILIFIAPVCARAQDTVRPRPATGVLPVDTARKIGSINRVKQPDTIANAPLAADSSLKPKHDPHKATLRSAILPGWGQAYNREYWKIPIVYAAIGIPIGTYFYNNGWYKKTRDAYTIVINNDTPNFSKIDKRLFYNGYPIDAASLQRYRNQFRQQRDYSILITLFAWALNVVDATVFGHLKQFDVSDDLSLKIKPSYNPINNTTNIGFALNFKERTHKAVRPVP